MLTLNDSLDLFRKYQVECEKYIEVELSESDTRSKFLDELFINVLDWKEEDITREEYGVN